MLPPNSILNLSWTYHFIKNVSTDIVLISLPWYAVSAPILARNLIVLIQAAFKVYLLSPDGYLQPAEKLDWVKDCSKISTKHGDFEDHVTNLILHLNERLH